MIAIQRDKKIAPNTEQSPRFALAITRRAYALWTDAVVLSGSLKQLLSDERIKAASGRRCLRKQKCGCWSSIRIPRRP